MIQGFVTIYLRHTYLFIIQIVSRAMKMFKSIVNNNLLLNHNIYTKIYKDKS